MRDSSCCLQFAAKGDCCSQMAATVRHAAARRQGQQASAAGEADNPGESAFLSVRNSIPAGVDAASSSSGPPSGSSRSDTSALPHREKGQNGLLIAPGLQYGIERHPLARGDSPLPEIPPSSEGIRSKWRAYFRQGTFFEDENFPEVCGYCFTHCRSHETEL